MRNTSAPLKARINPSLIAAKGGFRRAAITVLLIGAVLMPVGCELTGSSNRVMTIGGANDVPLPPPVAKETPTVDPVGPAAPTKIPSATIAAVTPTTSPAATAAPAGPTKTVLLVHIAVGNVEVPTGVASGGEELWSYLDEEPVSRKAKMLGLNGIRVGVGRADVWPDLARILKKMTGQEYQSAAMQMMPGKSNSLTLKNDQPAQTIFTYYANGSLSGQDYPAGDDLLTISGTVNPDRPDRSLLTILPQIRTKKQHIEVIQRSGAPALVERPTLIPLDHLTFQLPVKNGDFLVIGPGIQARRDSSVGHYFLTKTKGGVTHETILIMQPKVMRVEVK